MASKLSWQLLQVNYHLTIRIHVYNFTLLLAITKVVSKVSEVVSVHL